MSTTESARRHATIIQPSEGDSFWQPVPANGHADPKLTPSTTTRPRPRKQICSSI